MDLYLKILITILVCLAIIVCIYLIIAYRRTRIVAKKLDYLVEDLTYKIEVLSPTIDSIAKLGKFIDVFDAILKDKTQNLIKYTSKNEEDLYKVAKEVKQVLKDTKKEVDKKENERKTNKVVKKDESKI